MQLKINSFNSKIYQKSVFIDVNSDIAREFIERATNIDIDLVFDQFKVKLEYNLQCTSVTLTTLDTIQLSIGPKRTILQYAGNGFFPPKTKIFRPL